MDIYRLGNSFNMGYNEGKMRFSQTTIKVLPKEILVLLCMRLEGEIDSIKHIVGKPAHMQDMILLDQNIIKSVERVFQ